MKILLSLILLGTSVTASAYVAPGCAAKNNMASLKLGAADHQDNVRSSRGSSNSPAARGLEKR